MKKGLKKITKILILIAMIFSDLMTPIEVFASEIASTTPKKGDVGINNEVVNNGEYATVSSGSLENAGDVKVTKTVSKTNTEGRYEIKFDIEGKDTTSTNSSVKPVYVVVVFDTSGSMQNYCIGKVFGSDKDMGTEENCGFLGGAFTLYPKWKNSVSGAKTFANTLLEKISDAQIALVTFAQNAETAREFENDDLDDADFGTPSGGTNLHAGLKEANKLLSEIPEEDKDAYKYVVVISDGQPTYYVKENNTVGGDGSTTTTAILDATFGEATSIKSNAEIFTIGYDLPEGNVINSSTYGRLTAEDILKRVASTDKDNADKGIYHYINADPEAVASAFTNIATSISIVNAGTNATLTDNVGSNFKIVDKEGNTYTNTIEKITEEKTTIKFYVDIDKDSPTGWYNTNEGFTLTYTDANGESQTIECNDNPQVYWVQNTYQYKVNYYKDTFDNSNLIAGETRTAPKNTVINESNVDKDKYLPTGYEFNTINPTSITITNTGEVKEINILYTIKKFNYTVNYYYDNILDNTLSKTKTDIPYGTSVKAEDYYLNDSEIKEGYVLDTANTDNGTYTITDNGVVINIYYKKNSYGYNVNYFFNNEKGFTTNSSAIYGDKITAESKYLTNSELSANNKSDYFLDPNKKEENTKEITIGTDTSKNVLDIYYINTNFNNTNEIITKKANIDKVTSLNNKVTYTINYNTSINNVREGNTVVVTIIDTLPQSIDVDNSTLNGGIYNSSDNTITWTKTYNISSYASSYSVSETITYTVSYTDYVSANGSTLDNEVSGKTTVKYADLEDITSNGTNDTESVDVEIKGTVTVYYKDEKGAEISTPTSLGEKLAGTHYTTTNKEIVGYTLDESKIPANKEGNYTEGNIDVIYYYTKNAGEIDNPKTEKIGPDTINSINVVFEYTITASGNIKEYVGEATLTVKDILPYAIDTDKSTLDNRCVYDGNKTITCIKEYKVTEKDYTNGVFSVNEEFNLKLVFVGIDKDTVVNKAESTIDLNGNKKTTPSNETETKVLKGSLIVEHRSDSTVLETEALRKELAGTEYTTNSKTFFGYTLDETKLPENATGEYIAEETIIVTYYYTKNIGTSEEELVKEGLELVGSINDAFDYTITYKTEIKDYVGKATLIITDILPYEIDTEKSVISNNCKYNKDDNTITCEYEKDNNILVTPIIGNININNNLDKVNNNIIFDIEENFKLYYINIDSNKVTNKVTAELKYEDTTKTTEDEYTSEVKEGTVIVNYVTKDGTKLTDSITLTGLVGTSYETSKKEFDKYSFIEVKGNAKGNFEEEVSEVTYVYDLVILPPQTGVETNMFMYVNYIFALIGIAFALRTYKTIKNN